MNYINAQNLTVDEAKVGFDLSQDGDLEDTIALTIEFDPVNYPETNGYHGTYLDLYQVEFHENLQWYLDNLDYAEGWTWFDTDGNAMSDEAVAVMSSADKAQAFIEGRYAKSSTGSKGMMGGLTGDLPDGEMPMGRGGEDDVPAWMAYPAICRMTTCRTAWENPANYPMTTMMMQKICSARTFATAVP